METKYRTKDKPLAAFLITKGFRFLGIDNTNFPYFFEFDDPDGVCSQLEHDYGFNNAEIPAREFYGNYVGLSRELEKLNGANHHGRKNNH